MITVLPLGVGDAFSAQHYSCCVALGVDDTWILVDCPHPVRKMMRDARAPFDVGDVHAVVLTHLHADHASGLETFAYFQKFVMQRRARVVCHPDVRRRLWDGHLAAGMEQLMDHDGAHHAHAFDDYFEHTALDDAQPIDVGPFRIECRKTQHHIATTALRISDRARGVRIGFSADTTFDPGLIAWLAECELFVHEVGYGVHTPLHALQALPIEVRAKLRLIHYPDDVDTAPLVKLEQGRALEL